jgi:hypothetical protein
MPNLFRVHGDTVLDIFGQSGDKGADGRRRDALVIQHHQG